MYRSRPHLYFGASLSENLGSQGKIRPESSERARSIYFLQLDALSENILFVSQWCGSMSRLADGSTG
jgi:hypothetical protein